MKTEEIFGRDTTVRLLLALEDLTGMTFRELFGECEGRR